jgi:hypothetical protein
MLLLAAIINQPTKGLPPSLCPKDYYVVIADLK